MDAPTQHFVVAAARIVAEAAADLGGLIAAPADAGCARALLARIAEVRAGAQAVALVEIARLAAEAEAPLRAAVSQGRTLDRASLQTVGWAVQALDGALNAAAAGSAPLAIAA